METKTLKLIRIPTLIEEVLHLAKDLVCGMEVDEKTAEHKAEHMGKTYYFCSVSCKSSFEETPPKYLKEEHRSMGMHHR